MSAKSCNFGIKHIPRYSSTRKDTSGRSCSKCYRGIVNINGSNPVDIYNRYWNYNNIFCVAVAAVWRSSDGRPVAVFDPQHLAEGVPAGLRWSPIRGCEDPLTAMIRATGLAAGTGLSAGGVEGGDFWEGKTRTALQALLHAAALDHRTPAELFRWTLDPAAASDAVAILTANPNAATGWADSLQAMIDSDPRTRDSIWQGVSLSLAALADPRVLDAVSPGPEERFDPEEFLRKRGTVYLLATGAGANNSAALVSAFVEDLVEAARRLAARSPAARLDPPLLLALDEIGNLAPLPSLPTLMAEGGGTGITTMPVLQSLAQAREKWSDNAAGAIWDATIVKIILGGASNSPRPSRPHHPHRRTRRDHRLHHHRRPRLPLRATLHPSRIRWAFNARAGTLADVCGKRSVASPRGPSRPWMPSRVIDPRAGDGCREACRNPSLSCTIFEGSGTRGARCEGGRPLPWCQSAATSQYFHMTDMTLFSKSRMPFTTANSFGAWALPRNRVLPLPTARRGPGRAGRTARTRPSWA